MTTAHDKHNNLIKLGDLVEVVYGGDHHTLVVSEITVAHGHAYVHGTVNVSVPASGVSRRKDENPTTAPRESAPVEPKSEHHVREELPKADDKPKPATGKK